MKRKIMAALLSLTMLGSVASQFTMTASAASPIVAFPGAEGAGKYATGGRGGTVYHVTNLNDSGAGSFRDAVSRSGRIIVFDVGGTINLKSDVVVRGNNTIAGQTAPGGGGITLKGGKIGMGGDNIIIRFVSSRPGENGSSECDAWGGSKGSNSMIDHCSIGWANDEQFGLYSSMQQTVQYSIVGPSNCISYHSKGCHGFGIMMGAGHNTWHHNMIADNISRNFRGKIGAPNTLDYVNNVIFNWGYQTAYGTFGHVNYVGNYFKKGQSTRGGYNYISISSGSYPEKYRFYLTGNKMVNANGTDHNSAMNSNNWIGVDYGTSGMSQGVYEVKTPFVVNDVYGNDASIARNAQSADAAYQTVLSYAGAGISAAKRPKIDRQVMDEARTGNGYLSGGRNFSTLTSSDTELNNAIAKYNIKQVNYDDYYPAQITKKEIVDSDNDGMPDSWENERGLNPKQNDAMGDYLGQGYNNIEYYINDLTVNAFPSGVVKTSPKGAEIGADFVNAQADANSLTLSTTTVKNVGDLVLPTRGAKGSSISWVSTSPCIVIQNNKITSLTRPSTDNNMVDIRATITNGRYSHTRTFSIKVLATPYKFDFGDGDVQSGFVPVRSSTTYNSNNGFGFVGSQSGMTRGPGGVTGGMDNLYSDQVQGDTSFRANIPNGTYCVTVHYGCWNDSFGTRFNIEGVDSGALSSTDPAEYSAVVKVSDGILDVKISKGDKSFGGYISGIEITTPPTPKYKFDFGDGDVQSGFEAVRSSTAYSAKLGYGFEGSQSGMTRGPGGVTGGMDNLYSDQVQGDTSFRANIPNGTYCVTVHYGCWNDSFGTRFNIEGVDSGALSSTGPAEYSAVVNVNDGTLNVKISKGDKAYGGYISGIEITTPPTPKYKFDFGDGDVQSGFEAVRSSTAYSGKLGYGFEGSLPVGMTRAPGEIASGMENMYNDQLNGNSHFKAYIPNGNYNVAIYYGSWNESFGTKYVVEGIETEALASTTAAVTAVPVEIKDGMLDVVIKSGDKAYGGYISGIEVLPIPNPTYKFDFGDGDVQDGFAAVKSTTAYSPYTGYGFSGALPAAMTRGPGNAPSGYEKIYSDQINGTAKFMSNIPNGRYDVTIHYGCWNTGFGTSYTVEGTQSGALFATDAAQYVARVDVKDGMLNIDINMGDKKYGGYISGIEIAPASSKPLPTPTPEPTPTPTPESTPEPIEEYADIAEGVYYIKSANSDMYLDVADGSSANGANLLQSDFTGETSQQFKVVSAGNGYYKLLTGCSDYNNAVDVSENSPENCANILTWKSGSGANQQFKFKDAGSGKYAILTRSSLLASALDVANISTEAGANIQQYAYWAGAGQQWYFEPVKEDTKDDASEESSTDDGYAKIDEGVYNFKSVNSGKYLDVMYGIADNGANIQQYQANGATAQQFKVVSTNDGYYKILTGCSNYTQAIDVDGGMGDNGANIQTWGDASQKNQQFKFIKESDGSYGILTRVSELKSCLDVSGVSKENGANVCQWEYRSGVGQRWILEKVK